MPMSVHIFRKVPVVINLTPAAPGGGQHWCILLTAQWASCGQWHVGWCPPVPPLSCIARSRHTSDIRILPPSPFPDQKSKLRSWDREWCHQTGNISTLSNKVIQRQSRFRSVHWLTLPVPLLSDRVNPKTASSHLSLSRCCIHWKIKTFV